jgi:tetratricopeptide (TPR) repeat protein
MNNRFISTIAVAILCTTLWLTAIAGEVKESVEGERLFSEGVLLYKQKDISKTVLLWWQALRHFRLDLGENHSRTILATQALATAYLNLQQYGKALELNELVFNARRIQFGENDLNTLNSMDSLALIYQKIGEYDKAL